MVSLCPYVQLVPLKLICLLSKDECPWSDCDGLDVKPSNTVAHFATTDEYVPGHT